MKLVFFLMSISIFMVGCGTVSGTVKGFGEDVKSGTDTVAEWVKPSKK